MNRRTMSALSLGVIVVLLGIIGYLVYALRLGGSSATYSGQTTYLTNTVRQISVRKINATNLLAALNRPASWLALESTNYLVYIANLRAFGCPEDTVKDIIITDIARLYARRRAELRRQLPSRNYWQADYSNGGAGSSTQLQALDREQHALVRELLGVDLKSEMAKYWGEAEASAGDYEYLPQQKRDQVLALQAKYNELEEEIYARTQGLMLDEDEEQLKTLRKQRETELAGILSPEEFENYELRHSSVAENLRSQLNGFGANEEEFRKLFRLHKEYDQQINQAFDVTDDAQWEVRARAQEQAQQALEAETRKLLGEQRYAELQRGQDGDYKTLVQLTERFELTRDVADKVYDMKVAAERQKLELESNPALTEQQRQAGLTALGRTTERAVAEALRDPRVFKSYRKAAGQWLQSLSESQFAPMPAEEQ